MLNKCFVFAGMYPPIMATPESVGIDQTSHLAVTARSGRELYESFHQVVDRHIHDTLSTPRMPHAGTSRNKLLSALILRLSYRFSRHFAAAPGFILTYHCLSCPPCDYFPRYRSPPQPPECYMSIFSFQCIYVSTLIYICQRILRDL